MKSPCFGICSGEVKLNSDLLVTPENVHKWNFSIIQCTVAVLLISVMAYLSVLLTEMLRFSDGEVSEDTFEAVVSTNP